MQKRMEYYGQANVRTSKNMSVLNCGIWFFKGSQSIKYIEIKWMELMLEVIICTNGQDVVRLAYGIELHSDVHMRGLKPLHW